MHHAPETVSSPSAPLPAPLDEGRPGEPAAGDDLASGEIQIKNNNLNASNCIKASIQNEIWNLPRTSPLLIVPTANSPLREKSKSKLLLYSRLFRYNRVNYYPNPWIQILKHLFPFPQVNSPVVADHLCVLPLVSRVEGLPDCLGQQGAVVAAVGGVGGVASEAGGEGRIQLRVALLREGGGKWRQWREIARFYLGSKGFCIDKFGIGTEQVFFNA